MIRTTHRDDLRGTLRAFAEARDGEGFRELFRNRPRAVLSESFAAEPVRTRRAPLRLLAPRERVALLSVLPAGARDELLASSSEEERSERLRGSAAAGRPARALRSAASERGQRRMAPAHAQREDHRTRSPCPEGSVGSVPRRDFAAVWPRMTASEAFARLRATATNRGTIDVLYALDGEGRLIGTLPLPQLVRAPEEACIAPIMRPSPMYPRPTWAKGEAATLIRRHDLLALPVIDGEGRMIGIVTVHDAMDIDKEEDAAQLTRFGGSLHLPGGPDLDPLGSALGRMYSVWVSWLAILTFFGVLTSTFVAGREEILAQAIVLAACSDPISDLGENAGRQSATLVIGAMAFGHVMRRFQDLWRLIRRELPVAAALGITIALAEAELGFLSKGVGLEVLAVVGLAMHACTMLGGNVGARLPFAARRLGTDPASLSAPMITAIAFSACGSLSAPNSVFLAERLRTAAG